MLPTIYKPTRITETTATLIDNLLTNNEQISDKFNDFFFFFFFVNECPKLASNIQNTGKNYFDYLHDMKSNSMYMKPIGLYHGVWDMIFSFYVEHNPVARSRKCVNLST